MKLKPNLETRNSLKRCIINLIIMKSLRSDRDNDNNNFH